MANKKFSQFETATNTTGLEVVGTQDGNNVKVDAALLAGGGGGGDYIPLSGTEVGKPITGDVEIFQNGYDDVRGFIVKQAAEATDAKIGFFTDGNSDILMFGRQNGSDVDGVIFSTPSNGQLVGLRSSTAEGQVAIYLTYPDISLSSNNPSTQGIIGEIHFVKTNPNAYAQMADLPQLANNYADDAAAAVGGIAVGTMYHTAGVVKIRLV